MRSIRSRVRAVRPWWRRFKRNGYRRERCAGCGHPFRWSRDARHSNGNRDGQVWHGPCLALETWRKRAGDRLRVVGVVSELTGITASDVREAMSLRDNNGQPGSGSDGWNVAWRVFYDLEKADREIAVHPGREVTP